jgi:RNA polymerase sigma factor (sigma-70 family)
MDISTMDSTHHDSEGRITVFARPATSPLEELQRRERALLVVLALEKLSSDHREVLLARHFGEQSFSQIALQMNRSEAATRMLWVRALRALRQIFLEEHENSEPPKDF